MDPTPTDQSLARSRSIGVGQALIAYLFWGYGTGIYFKLLDEVNAFELLAWRVLAGLPVMLVLLALPPGYGRIRDAFRGRGATLLLTLIQFGFIVADRASFLDQAIIAKFTVTWTSLVFNVVGQKIKNRNKSMSIKIENDEAIQKEVFYNMHQPTRNYQGHTCRTYYECTIS